MLKRDTLVLRHSSLIALHFSLLPFISIFVLRTGEEVKAKAQKKNKEPAQDAQHQNVSALPWGVRTIGQRDAALRDVRAIVGWDVPEPPDGALPSPRLYLTNASSCTHGCKIVKSGTKLYEYSC